MKQEDSRNFLKKYISSEEKPYKGETNYYKDKESGEIKMLVGYSKEEKEEYLKKHPELIAQNPKTAKVTKGRLEIGI